MPETSDSNPLPLGDHQDNVGPIPVLPNDSEAFGSIRKRSEAFRKIPNDAETFRSIPKGSERRENHTLTVREVARMFEVAGVARTERSIVNWCQPSRTGIARLDAYFDPNERKYYISPQSVELAIAEEKAKAAKISDSEPFRTVPKDTEASTGVPKASETPEPLDRDEAETKEVKKLQNEIMDLKITNAAKNQVIEMLRQERGQMLEQVVAANRKVGELEAKLLQLEAPNHRV